MKLLYKAPETTVVIVNCEADLMQTEVFGESLTGEWGSGTNSSIFDSADGGADFERESSSPSLWNE